MIYIAICPMCGRIPGLFTGHGPARGSGREVFEISRVGSDQKFFLTLTGRVGSGLPDLTGEV